MNESQKKYYHKLKEDIEAWKSSGENRERKWRRYVEYAPEMFKIICSLALDPETKPRCMARLTFAMTYFISPNDIMPEKQLGKVGFLDDVFLAACALSDVMENTTISLLMKHWEGDENIAVIIKEILDAANEFLGEETAGTLRMLYEQSG